MIKAVSTIKKISKKDIANSVAVNIPVAFMSNVNFMTQVKVTGRRFCYGGLKSGKTGILNITGA